MPSKRRPRAYFTEKLERMLCALDQCNEREYQFNGALSGQPPKLYWARTRVRAVWVYGSYARGALLCGDLDLIVDFESSRLPERPWARPRSRDEIKAFWRGIRDVQINAGTPEKNTSNVAPAEAQLVWKPGIEWKHRIEAIVLDPTATRFVRITDELPFDYRRQGLDIRTAQELVHMRDADLLRWSLEPLQFDQAMPANLTGDEEWAVRYVSLSRGNKANALMAPVLPGMRRLQPKFDPHARGWNNGGELRWADFEVQLGNANVSLQALEDIQLRGFIIAPFLRARDQNALWIIERGDRFPEGLPEYEAQCRERDLAAG